MGKVDGTFKLTVLSETKVVFDDRCEALFVPSVKESMVILAHHTPMIAKLGAGEVVVKQGRSRSIIANIDSGLIYVGDNEATVLLDL